MLGPTLRKFVIRAAFDRYDRQNLGSTHSVFSIGSIFRPNVASTTVDAEVFFLKIISKNLSVRQTEKIIKEKNKAEVNASQIILKDELKKIGTYKVDINFHSEVKASISIKIDKIQSK